MNSKNEKCKTSIPGRLCLLRQVKYGLRAKRYCLKVTLIPWTGNLLSVVLLFKISENLLESKLLKTSCKLPYFDKNQLCACLIYACT